MLWKIQFQITKIVLAKSGVDSFRIATIKIMATEIYKILNDMGPDYLSCLFSKSNTPYQLRDDNKLIQPLKRTTTFGIKSFAYFGTHFWNMLPNHIKNSVSLYDFKSLIRKWSGPTCCCSVCTQVVWSLFCRYESIYYGIWLYHFHSGIYEKILSLVAFISIIHIYLVLLKFSIASTFL